MAQVSYAPPQGSLPANVMQQAAQYQLGTFHKEYSPSISNPFVIAGILVGSIILDIAVLIGLLMATGYISFYLLIVPVLVLIWAIRAFQHAGWHIYVFSDGYIHVRGSQIDVFRWDLIQAVYVHLAHSRSGVKVTLQVRRGDGVLLKYGSAIRGVNELCTTIQESVTRAQLPRVIDAFNSGAQIPFGRLNISQQGINDGRQVIPWEQINGIEVQQDRVAIRQNGRIQKLKSIKAAELPNFNLLMSLVNYVVNRRYPQNYRQ
ncbi:hypothetical protein KDA_19530 [Dictyobacter alpinus]|uniref:Uncharacterized protein n=1 Tax=Dictyobacter alpinus TaxID=2014873 RepID=A0A402B547_9CHLR|nr:DUF6585 family protein [Dictyobacter alpinus]GCE26469.1 hypothetical protein KDA_19530 [Dictyobacter alpinus]